MAECFKLCRSSRISRADFDQITDGLGPCLNSDVGRQEFKDFLHDKNLDEKDAFTLWEMCANTLSDAGRLSPGSQIAKPFSEKVDLMFENICNLAENVNFDQGELNLLYDAMESSPDQKLQAIKKCQVNAMNLLQKCYDLFKTFLNKKIC